jgi:hypothetical protein
MASKNELLLRLMERVDSSSEATALRDATVLWMALLGKFSPLIGPSSVHVLFVRSIDLNRADFPWLPPIPPTTVGAMQFSAFEAVLKTRRADEVVAATRALLGTYIESLFTLIGASLTAQFVSSAVGGKRDQNK